MRNVLLIIAGIALGCFLISPPDTSLKHESSSFEMSEEMPERVKMEMREMVKDGLEVCGGGWKGDGIYNKY